MGRSWGGEELGGGYRNRVKEGKKRMEVRIKMGTEGDVGTTTFWAGAPFLPRKH